MSSGHCGLTISTHSSKKVTTALRYHYSDRSSVLKMYIVFTRNVPKIILPQVEMTADSNTVKTTTPGIVMRCDRTALIWRSRLAHTNRSDFENKH